MSPSRSTYRGAMATVHHSRGYGARSLASTRLPGALLSEMTFTL